MYNYAETHLSNYTEIQTPWHIYLVKWIHNDTIFKYLIPAIIFYFYTRNIFTKKN